MFLPHELIIQILLRLPVKPLIRFKCVCKLWFSLISHDSHFANSHFQLAAATHNRRILLISTLLNETRSIDFEVSLDPDSAVSLNLNGMFPEYFTGFKIKGSCRGFILLCSSFNIYLWNPSTGVQKQIPLSPFGSNLYAEYFYGFGYDNSTDDYLVVSMSHHDSGKPPLHLEYFSLKANTWKEVEGPHFPYSNSSEDEPKGGFLYNGAIHWLAFRYDLQSEVIVTFDLMEKKLSYMHLPPDFDGNPFPCGLWAYEEFLSVWSTNYTNETLELWVMNEYKMSSSWTLSLVLPPDANEDFSLLCRTKSGDIIGTDSDHALVKYDDNGQFLEKYSYFDYDQVAMHIDSLLSLPSDGDSEQASQTRTMRL